MTHCVTTSSSKIRSILHPLLIALALLPIAGCGSSGGGGDGFVGAADVSLQVEPTVIDTGDRAQVTTEINSVNENGIFLKFRYPDGLSYVKNSAVLRVSGKDIDISPSTNKSSGDFTYLVFILSRSLFNSAGNGRVTFEVEGNSEFTTGSIEVDPDVNDPLKNDSTEFSVTDPEFGAEDAVDVEVVS